MSNNQPQWTWSPEHNNYYYVSQDSDGQYIYTWASSVSAAPPASAPQTAASQIATPQAAPSVARTDSVADEDINPPAPVPLETRATLRNFIAGTPDKGWFDGLDRSYRMRTGAEARQFFKRGRVFATLYTEPTGETAHPDPWNDAYTTVKFGQSVYTQIRRFVVVSVRKNFVYALAIATYGGRGTLKRGCNPGEHSVIFNSNVDPKACYLPREYENGLYKDPIEVTPPYPTDNSSYLTSASRIRFGKAYAIEWNVKVKDIGTVVSSDMSKLLRYYKDEDREV